MKNTFLFLLLFTLSIAGAQESAKERIKVYSRAIEGNLVNDPAEREVTVCLPPSYQTEPDRRHPVLYMLHGFTDSDSQWFGWEEHWINLHEVLGSYGIPHFYESYEGGHLNRIAERIRTKALPFFSEHLGGE